MHQNTGFAVSHFLLILVKHKLQTINFMIKQDILEMHTTVKELTVIN